MNNQNLHAMTQKDKNALRILLSKLFVLQQLEDVCTVSAQGVTRIKEELLEKGYMDKDGNFVKDLPYEVKELVDEVFFEG